MILMVSGMEDVQMIRVFQYRSGWWLLLSAVMCCGLYADQSGAAKRPNILLIMSDDMGYSDLGCYGGEINTPALDRLADNGLRYSQFYNAARCCPTRAALLTGLYPHQAGMGFMVSGSGIPAYQGFLNDRCVTIAEVLREAGYRTYISGKWHVGEKRPNWPVDRGFDFSYSLISGASSFFELSPTRTMAINDQPYVPKGDDFYMTDAFTDNAVDFINKHGEDDRPFFLYLSHTAPHWPLHAWPEDIARYRGKYMCGWDELRRARHKRLIEAGLLDPGWPLTARDQRVADWTQVSDADKDQWDLKMAVYAAQIDRMDQGIGRIVARLEQMGKLDNTLIMFLHDNGGCAEVINQGKPGVPAGHRDSFLSYGIGWANASNTPFRLYKHWVHEGGIATPFIVHWPAMIKQSRISHDVGHIIDIMATCLDAAGVDYPETFKGQNIIPSAGRSLIPSFKGQDFDSDRPLFWEHEGNRAVRKGHWKLVARHRQPWELYDLQADRTEMNDLAEKHPDTVQELAALYEQWAEKCGVLPWQEFLTRREQWRKKQ